MLEVEYRPIGENNVDDPADVGAQVPRTRKTIFTEVARLINVDVNNSGGITLRNGYVASLRVAGLHSGWSNPYDPIEGYFVNGTLLNRINKDGSITIVKYDMIPGLPVTYCQINDVTAYSNGIQFGIIENGVDTDPYYPDAMTNVGNVTIPSNKQRMAAGTFMEFYNGRLYALVDNFQGVSGCALICSDAMGTPGALESMEMAPTGPNPVAVFVGHPKMLMRIESKQGGGLFVSAGDETFWISGADAMVDGGFDGQQSVAPYAAIPGTFVPIKGELTGVQGLTGNCILWASTRGVCIGAAGGYFANLTMGKVSYPAGAQGAAVLREQGGLTHFVCAIEGVGAPYNEFEVAG